MISQTVADVLGALGLTSSKEIIVREYSVLCLLRNNRIKLIKEINNWMSVSKYKLRYGMGEIRQLAGLEDMGKLRGVYSRNSAPH
jgi:hypothetical protein